MKTLNPKDYAAKYQYLNGLDVLRSRETGMSQMQEKKTST